ncbi:Golgi reassembly-stacking protein 2 [Yarrowia sp. C11]|nr:Golgi reassembly-stacking protein 2 [Yarrowia sp. E02]KAG5372235.1 Golgi reassembly-stacking protein 2 [Yarrowia sp. C11]
MFAFAQKLVSQADKYINEPRDEVDDQPCSHGFRVLHVEPNSIAQKAGLEALYDFIIAVDGETVDHETQEHNPYARQSLDQPVQAPVDRLTQRITGDNVTLTVFSSKGHTVRNVLVDASTAKPEFTEPDAIQLDSVHGGEFVRGNDYDKEALKDASTPPGLGVSLQYTPLDVGDYVWHVLDVAPNSPAERAGLIAHSDYIVGGSGGLLASGGEDLLSRVVAVHFSRQEDCPIQLFVYNSDYNITRPVLIMPMRGWGGAGLLGCGVGYGLLHRLPEFLGVNRPGDTVFNADDRASASPAPPQSYQAPPQGGIPAVAYQAPSAYAPPPAAGPRRAKKPVAASNDFSDYFAEQEKASREADRISLAAQPTKDIPPPPKKS